MPAYFSGTGTVYNYQLQASYGAYGSITLTGGAFTYETFRLGGGSDNNYGEAQHPFVRGVMLVANGATLTTEDQGPENDPVNGFTPAASIGNSGANGGIAQGALYIVEGSSVYVDSDLIFNPTEGEFVNGYGQLRIGRGFGGQGSALVEDSGSQLIVSGGAARMDVGRSGGVGSVDIREGGVVGSFNLTLGRNGFGFATVDGAGSELNLGRGYGPYGADPGSSSSTPIGRDFNGRGILSVGDGGTVNVENDPGNTDNPDMVIGRGYGSTGYAVVSGQGSTLNVNQIGVVDDDTNGSSFRLGDAGRGIVVVEGGGAINVTGEGAFLGISEERDGLVSALESKLVIRNGGTVTVDSANTATNGAIQIARDPGAKGAIIVDGAGSELVLRTDSTAPAATGSGLSIGLGGAGRLDVTNGGKVSIDGGDDTFPFLMIGRGTDGAQATSTVLVSGAGSEIEVAGTQSDPSQTNNPGGFISVGRNDQKTGILVIEGGGVVRMSNPDSTSEIAGNAGATGYVTVDGAGSLFAPGVYLAIGSDYVGGGGFDGAIGGTGTLTLSNGGRAEAGTFVVGQMGTINLGSTLTGNVTLQGGLVAVGGTGAGATGIVDGDLNATNGAIELEVLDFATGAVDRLDVTGALDVGFGQIVLDASNLARAVVGQSAVLIDAGSVPAGFGVGNITITGEPSGVFLGLASTGGEITVNIATAPDTTVGLSGGDVTIAEGDPGDDARVTLTLLRSGDLTSTMSVDFAVSGGTADATDFQGGLPSGTVTFAAGEDSATLEIRLAEDDIDEADETFNVVLTSVSTGSGAAATILNNETVVTILDDDDATATVSNGNVVFGDSFPTPLQVISVDPTASYIDPPDLDAADTDVTGPLVLDLAALGFSAGDLIFVDPQGDLSPFLEDPDGDGTFEPAAERPGRLAVAFADAQPDIVAAPRFTPLYISDPSANDGNPRDLQGDTIIGQSGGLLRVPTGAVNLGIGVVDSFFSDNADADGDFGLVLFRPTGVGFSGNGELTLTNESRQDAAVMIGVGQDANDDPHEGLVIADDTNWLVSADLSVGEQGGAGRLILDGRSNLRVQDFGGYGLPTDPNLRVGTNSGNGYLAVVGGSDIVVGSDLQYSGPGVYSGGYANLQIGMDNGIGAVLVEGEGSSVSAIGYNARIILGHDGGTGLLDIRDGGTVQTRAINAGLGHGDALVNVTGDGSAMVLSSAYGRYAVSGVRGYGPFSNFGRSNGDGQFRITDGGLIRAENTNGLTDGVSIQLGRDAGASGEGEVSGAGSRLEVIQNGPLGDNSFGNVALDVGQGGRGELTVSDSGAVLIQGDSARLNVSRGRDGKGDVGELAITSGGTVTVDSLGYGARTQQTGTDNQGNAIYRDGGARVTVGLGRNTNGEITVSGTGSALTLASTSIEAGDYSTGELELGRFGTGRLTVSDGGYVAARELELGEGVEQANGNSYAGRGFVSVNSGGRIVLYTPDNPLKALDPENQPSAYRGLRIAHDNAGTYGRVDVDGAGSELTSSGGAGRIQVGAEGTGRLNITDGGLVQGFFLSAGQDGRGYVTVDGAGSQLLLSNDFGEFGNGYGNEAAYARFGRNDGGHGRLDITNGGTVTLENAAGTANESAVLTFGRLYRSEGVLNVDGGTLDLRVTGSSGDLINPGSYYGPELRMGREGGKGTATVANGGVVNIIGEQAELVVGRGPDNNGNAGQSTLTIASGGTVNVASLGYEVGAYAVAGRFAGSNGRIVVDGAGAALNVSSRNVNDLQADGSTAYGAAVLIGQDGMGALEVTNGGQVTIDGDDDAFPALVVGRNDGSVGTVLVTGAGSAVTIIGTRIGETDGGEIYGAGALAVGLRNGSNGTLTIADGGRITNTATNSSTSIGKDAGAIGALTVDGAGSLLEAGARLLVGIDAETDSNAPDVGETVPGGTGTLTLSGGGEVRVGVRSDIGATSTLALGGLLVSPVLVTEGRIDVGGNGTIGTGEIEGAVTNLAGSEIVFEFDGLSAGQADLLVLDPVQAAADFGAPTARLDLSGLGGIAAGGSVRFVDFDGAVPDPALFQNTVFDIINTPIGFVASVFADGEGDWLLQVLASETQIEGSPDDDDLTGGALGETITALAGNDTVDAGGGDDLVDLGVGDDTADGGTGTDTLSFASIETPMLGSGAQIFGAIVDLASQGTPQNTGQGTDVFTGFENLEGSDFNDILFGDSAQNTISGGGGRDLLGGAAGNDTLFGGGDFDVLIGGTGADVLYGGTTGGDSFESDLVAYFSVTEALVFDFGTTITDIQAGSSAAVREDVIGDDIEAIGGAENVSNTFLADEITGLTFFLGGSQADTFVGGSGTDQLIGLAGNDIMYGNDGQDALIGEGGDDQFYPGDADGQMDFIFIDAVNEGDDVVFGLELGIDVIEFSGRNVTNVRLQDIAAGGTVAMDTLLTYEVNGTDAGTITIIDIDAATVERDAIISGVL